MSYEFVGSVLPPPRKKKKKTNASNSKKGGASITVRASGVLPARRESAEERAAEEQALFATVFNTLKTPLPFQRLIFKNLPKYKKSDDKVAYALSVLKVIHSKKELAAIHRDFGEGYDAIPADAEALALLASMRAPEEPALVSPMQVSTVSTDAGAPAEEAEAAVVVEESVAAGSKFPTGLALAGAAVLAFFILRKK